MPDNGSSSTYWTVQTLKEYIEQRFSDQARAIDTALASAEKAVAKAETSTEKRFDSVNEFRKTLTDQASLFLNRETFDAFKDRISQDVSIARQDAQVSVQTLQKTHAAETEAIYKWAGDAMKTINVRIEKLEATISRLIGALTLASVLIPVVLYLIGHH